MCARVIEREIVCRSFRVLSLCLSLYHPTHNRAQTHTKHARGRMHVRANTNGLTFNPCEFCRRRRPSLVRPSTHRENVTRAALSSSSSTKDGLFLPPAHSPGPRSRTCLCAHSLTIPLCMYAYIRPEKEFVMESQYSHLFDHALVVCVHMHVHARTGRKLYTGLPPMARTKVVRVPPQKLLTTRLCVFTCTAACGLHVSLRFTLVLALVCPRLHVSPVPSPAVCMLTAIMHAGYRRLLARLL